MEKVEHIYHLWKRTWNVAEQKGNMNTSEARNIIAVWNEMRKSSQKVGLGGVVTDWFSFEDHSLDETKEYLTSNLFIHEQLSYVLQLVFEWDNIEFPSRSGSLFELFCLLLNKLLKCSSLPTELSPLLVFAWLKFRWIFSTFIIQETEFLLNVAELIFTWFPHICRIISNLTPPRHHSTMKKDYKNLEFTPCLFCKTALMECEYLITRVLERFSGQERCHRKSCTILRAYILKTKINNYLCREENSLLLDIDPFAAVDSALHLQKIPSSLNPFSMNLSESWDMLKEQQRLNDDLAQFHYAIWRADSSSHWEMQLVEICKKLRSHLFDSVTEERIHKHVILCELLEIVINAPETYQTDCVLLNCVTLKLQMISKFLLTVSKCSIYAGCTTRMVRQEIQKSYSILKILSRFLEALERKQNETSSFSAFSSEMTGNMLLLLESLCLMELSLAEMKDKGESLEWLIKSTSNFRKWLLLLLHCISKTCGLLLSTWESWIIQSCDDHILDLMGRCLALFCVVLRYISQRENLQRMRTFRSIVKVYCTCLRRWINACNASDQEAFLMLKEWDNVSSGFVEKLEHPSLELAAGYYYRYGLRAPSISDDDLNSHWLTRELSSQSFITSLNPAHVVEFYYAFQKELEDATSCNRRGLIGEMKRTLNTLLNVFFSVEDPVFEPLQLFDQFKSALASISEGQLEDETMNFERILSSVFSSFLQQSHILLEGLVAKKKNSSVDISEYREVLVGICGLTTRCLGFELEIARKKLKAMSLNAHFALRRKLLEELLGLQLFSVSLEPKRANCWLLLGEVALELSHIDKEMKHLEMDESAKSQSIHFRFEECAKIFALVWQLASCSDHVNAKNTLMKVALQGEGICYFLAGRQAATCKDLWWRLAVRSLDRLFEIGDKDSTDGDDLFSLLRHNSWSWWYFLTLRGKLGFKLRESIESICWFLREAILSHRTEATKLKQEFEMEPFYQFDMIRLKILLHSDDFSFTGENLKILLDDSIVYPSVSNVNNNSVLGMSIVFDFSNCLGDLSNQVIQHMNYIWDSHLFRNGSRSSGYLYKPYYAQAFAYKVGLQMNERALESVRYNIFHVSLIMT